MRPAIINRFMAELPPGVYRPLLRPYLGQPWQQVITSARTRLLPRTWRQRHYQRVKQLAEGLSLKVRLCGCKNPDLGRESCDPWGREDRPEREKAVPTLFPLWEAE